MPCDAKDDQSSSLTAQPAQHLSTKVSLVSRGLIDIAKSSSGRDMIAGDKKTNRQVDLNRCYVTCEECGTEYSPGAVKLLPISDALRFELWPDDMKMFFCAQCDSNVVMPPPNMNEE